MAFEQTASGIYLDQTRRKDYRLADNSKLTAYVQDQIVEKGRPGIIKMGELDPYMDSMDIPKTLQTLPNGMSEEDLADINMLALKTEAPTLVYGKKFKTAARQYGQPWYGLFADVWVDDEMTHANPFEKILLQMGYSQDELNKNMREAQEVPYVIEAGSTPIHITGFTTMQEFITRYYYQLIIRALRPGNPRAAEGVTRIMQREAFHTVWSRDMTALQLEENPDQIFHLAEALANTQMPGHQVAPELQPRASEFLVKLGADFPYMKKQLIDLTVGMTKTPERLGQLTSLIAQEKSTGRQAVTLGVVNQAMHKFGIPGYGLVGEALMVSAGMGASFTRNEHTPAQKFRGRVRTWLAGHISQKMNADIMHGTAA